MQTNKNSGAAKAHTKSSTKSELRFSLSVFVFKENEAFIAYCPSLDLSSSGETYNDALGNFYEALQLYIECSQEFGTLHDDLVKHGWTVSSSEVKPPSFLQLK